MKASDPGRDQTAAELSRLLPAAAERDFPPGRQQSLKEHLMSEIRTERETGRARARPPRRRAVAAGAVVGAAAVAALVTMAVTGQGSITPRPPHAAAPVTAAYLLDQVAAAAARQSAPAGSGQFWYTQSETARDDHSAHWPRTAVLPKPHERQDWWSIQGECVAGEINDPTDGLSHVPSRLPQTNSDPKGPCQAKAGFENPTEAWLQSLPTDPRALLSMLAEATNGFTGKAQDNEEFVTVGDLFDQAIAPPQVSAALFRAAALIPGVTADQHVTDALGRPAVAVGFTSGGTRSEWLFNPGTLQYVGSRELDARTGKVGDTKAIVVQAFVNHVGEVPPGS